MVQKLTAKEVYGVLTPRPHDCKVTLEKSDENCSYLVEIRGTTYRVRFEPVVYRMERQLVEVEKL
jgi:hypothetical protein